MTEAIAFDTHRFVRRLTDSGFTEKQAETLAEEYVSLLNSNLATKADIAATRADIAATRADIVKTAAELEARIEATNAELEARIEATKTELEARIEATNAELAKTEMRLEARIEAIKADLLKWMFGAMIAQGGLIIAFVKLL